MGCITSKSLSADGATNSSPSMDGHDISNHIVSLTSTTYGVLKLDSLENHSKGVSSSTNRSCKSYSSSITPKFKKKPFANASPEIINWVFVDETPTASPKMQKKENRTPSRVLRPIPFIENKSSTELKKSQLFDPELVASHEQKPHEENGEIIQSPDKDLWEDFIDQTPTSSFKPQKNNTLGKENRAPSRVFRPLHFSEKKMYKSPHSPLFDPELVASLEQELHEEAEQIKRILPPSDLKEKYATFGEDKAAVLYTTSLRGIRRTFEDCNFVRSVIESYNVHVIEKDVSMDMGFREELRKLVGSKEAKSPVLLVKGEIVRGAGEVLRLENEGKLKLMLKGILPAALGSCRNCGGLKFLVCQECTGSCKVLDSTKKKKIKCNVCNENGLVFCPSCF